jgi:hypothetical protein
MVNNFPNDFWEEMQSKVEFIPTEKIPDNVLFTAVKMFLFEKNKILLTKVPRGWDLPTGHKENNEDIFQAVKRETEEETGIIANQSQFIGYLKLAQVKQNEKNKKYPLTSGIGVFACKNFVKSNFDKPLCEATKRCFRDINSVSKIHHRWSPLMESIMRYAYSIES